MGLDTRKKKSSNISLFSLKIPNSKCIILQTLKVESIRATEFKTLCLMYSAMFLSQYIDVLYVKKWFLGFFLMSYGFKLAFSLMLKKCSFFFS
jgi:hypothetical protein